MYVPGLHTFHGPLLFVLCQVVDGIRRVPNSNLCLQEVWQTSPEAAAGHSRICRKLCELQVLEEGLVVWQADQKPLADPHNSSSSS